MFSGDLIFDELPDRKGCRIEARLGGAQIGDRDRWPELLDWMIDTQTRLRNAVAHVGEVPRVTPVPGSPRGGPEPVAD